MTWNLGGCSEEKCTDFLPGLIDGEPMLKTSDVLMLQETTQKKVSPTPLTLRGWYLTLHKHDDEWRDQGILSMAKWAPPRRICAEVGVIAAEL